MEKSKFSFIKMLLCMAVFAACNNESQNGIEPEDNDQQSLGWQIHLEDFSKYPRNISYDFKPGEGQALPPSVDLSGKLPPVGNQGQFGTCVTWSTAYGLRSYLNAVSNDLSASELAENSNQFSPSDLFMAIKSSDKIANCGGTNFHAAFDALVSRGVATMHTAPYVALDCNGAPEAEWMNDAANYKICNYRMIDKEDWSVNNLKMELSHGRVICFGARLGDNFYNWKNGNVLNSETYLRPNTQNSYHAMLLAGYDDGKGAKGAFKVYNSWGTYWGDKGYIWIDYDFFINQFIYCAFVATLDENAYPYEKPVLPNPTDGTDLAVYNTFDEPYSDPEGKMNRRIFFNVYNIGKEPIAASRRWSVIYMYYNAFNAKDNGILMHLYFTDEVQGIVSFEKSKLSLTTPVGGTGYCINQNLPSGSNIASVCIRPDSKYYEAHYKIPKLSGYYYLLMIVDPFDRVDEKSKANNFLYISDPLGYPLSFQDGKVLSAMEPMPEAPKYDPANGSAEADEPMRNPVSDDNPNTYNPNEIKSLVKNLYKK